MQPTAGSHIGPYTLLASRGRGGMGEVFEAHDKRLDRRVAIKLLHPDRLASPKAHDRVMREARAAARVSHPNIAAVFDVLDVDGQPAIVMELVEGDTLSALIRRGPVPAERAAAIGVQLADAVAAAHANGVVHRDLKPSNVVLGPTGNVKVLDFGVARLELATGIDDTTRPGTPTPEAIDGSRTTGFVGTPRYAAPEQLRGERVDGRADLFAIGAVLFELLTGQPAFDGPDALAIAVAIARGDTPPASRLNPLVPPSLSAIVTRALRPDPDERFQSASELAEALRALLDRHGHLEPATEPGVVTDPAAEPSAAAGPRLGWKGFAAIVAAFAATIALGLVVLHTSPAGARPLPVVTVLPFVNATGDPSLGDLGVGVADTLTATLSTVPGLVVVARPAALGTGNRGPDLRRLASELGVTHAVNGSVQRAGTRWRLTATIVRGDASVAWGREYEGGADDIFTLQRRLAEGIGAALQGPAMPESPPSQPTRGTADVDALTAYSQARALLERSDVPGNIDAAIERFLDAVRRDPTFALAYAGLGAAYWQRYRWTSDAQWVPRAIEASTNALALDPYQADVQVSLATIYQGTGRLEEALVALERAVRLQPRNDEAFQGLGAALAGAGRRADSLAAYRRAIELRPGYWRHHYDYAIELFNQGLANQAIGQLQEVISLQPDNASGYQALGTVYHSLDDLPRARTSYEQAIQRGGSPNAFSNLGAILHWQGHYREAIDAYTRAASRLPKDPIIQRNLGDARLKLGDRVEARAAYERALAVVEEQLGVSPKLPSLRADRAVYEAKLGRLDAALQHIGEVREEATRQAELAYASAVVFALAGRTDEALGWLARAIALGYQRTLAARDDDLAQIRRDPRYRPLRPLRAGSQRK